MDAVTDSRAYTLRTPEIAARMKADVMRLPCDGTVRVIIEPVEAHRTDAQNRRYWAVIGAAQDWIEQQEHRRLSKDVIHEWLKQERFGLQIEQIAGKIQHVPKRTRTMGRREFSEYAEWAEHYMLTVWGVPAEMIDPHAVMP